ncbi:MAG TPA: M14 family zinc carboxypeptidase, partial [Candidatus Cloacimonadota bacterium]|nr:M14 family zinc carboxypeptidase [Candidatus Cloacimonadota bacterium]
MKRISLIIVLIAIVFTLLAYPVRIQSWNLRADVKTLNEARIGIDNVDHRNGVIIAYVRDGAEFDRVRGFGFDPVRLPEPHLDYARELWNSTKDSRDPMNAYYSIDEYNAFMQNIAAQYPQICSLVSIGNSGQNRPLWYLKISDNASVNEAEPEIRMVSSIHGDEVVGFDMLIRLIQLLTSQYNQTPRITNIVNSSEIFINPMYNPDGYALQQRYNAAGYDLNRNFPMPTGEQHPDGNAWGVENIAFMNYSPTRNFSQSINYHGGALVINYPWDYTYTLTPDDALIQQLSLAYSTSNSPMYNGEFEQGITNGAAWYVITGSLQDWTYGYTDCIDITAEIGYNKWPPANQLDTFWSQNQESMLNWIEFAQKGLHGSVSDTSGNPLDASITISGNGKIWHTDPALGDYHRPLLGGTYTVTANADGFIGETVVVNIPAGASLQQNFSLQPAGQTPFHGIVRAQDGIPVSGATVSIGTTPPTVLSTDANGVFSLAQIYEGNYPLTISAADYALCSQTLVIDQGDAYQAFILSAPLFEDDFENGITNWIANTPWAIAPDGSNHVLKDSPAGNYSNNINRSIRLATPFALQNVSNPALSFKAKYALETGYDFVYVEASANGSSWTQIASFTGIQSTYQIFSYSLSAFTGGVCHLRFRIETDQSQNADGISIDDFQVSGNQGEIIMA